VTADIEQALARIRAWGEERDWRGYDPYDALNSPAAPLLTIGTRTGRRALTQAVKLSPLNIRPLLGIRPDLNAKAIGLVSSGYVKLAAAGDATARREADRWLAWLALNHSGDDAGSAWGYHFDVQTRFFFYRRGTPNTIATSFVAQAFLDAVELLGAERWSEPALAASRFLVARMLATGPSGSYFRYLPEESELVHNANVLACAVLARTAAALGEREFAGTARDALATSLVAQREDGSWPYAAGPHGDWVDNFHTGYVLESLARCVDVEPTTRERLERGLDYWERELFMPDGTPMYAPGRVHPLDAHCYATAIDTWLAVAERRPGALEWAERIASLLVERMLDPAGFVYFQQRRLWTSRVPFVRWTTAPSFRALAALLERRRGAAVPGTHARLD
jgi:polysaccharide biosynthesis protein VpsJ